MFSEKTPADRCVTLSMMSEENWEENKGMRKRALLQAVSFLLCLIMIVMMLGNGEFTLMRKNPDRQISSRKKCFTGIQGANHV